MAEITRNELLFVTAIAAAGLLLAGMFMFPSGEKDGVSADATGQGVEPNSPPVAVETETPDAESESGLKLVERIGPIEFPPYGATTNGRIVVQTEEIKIEGFRVIASVSSRRDTSVSIVEANPEKRIVVFLLLKDEQGNTIESLSGEDLETGTLYFLRESREYGAHGGNTIVAPKYAVCSSERKADKLEDVYSWEVLVYIG